MDRKMRVTVGTVLVFAVGAVLLSANAAAGQAQTRSVELVPIHDSGVSGTAIFQDSQGGVEVGLSVRGLPEAGVKHINHVHGGAMCADERAGRGAPATIPLKTLVAKENGDGEAATSLGDITVDQLFATDKERYVLVHEEAKKGEGIPPGIACADLVWSAGRTPGAGIAADEQAPVEVMPDTGGTRFTVLLLPAAAALALIGLAVVISFRDRA
ncbi:hypothetical protein GBA63_11215 [Rubrobacter tropicus]|uniref:CHRD domain-containing protein n=1 Tax=Rubrobacter tropicus TaxID=2653851 RepID=A0A6G8Q9P4_9ACTN|nr:hypothetical protein [Rubrobacter tropicus]QIN83148.1 hypothetical protein GBA63_11215 [Rubrobacter tropicus]